MRRDGRDVVGQEHAIVIRRALSDELMLESGYCPHRSPLPEVQDVADDLCAFHTHAIRGFAQALNPRITIEAAVGGAAAGIVAIVSETDVAADKRENGRDNGRKVNGIGAIFLTLLCVTGLVVWWPGSNWRSSSSYRRAARWCVS